MIKHKIIIYLSLLGVGCKTIQPTAPTAQNEVAINTNSSKPSNIEIPVTMDLSKYFIQAENSVPIENIGSDNPCEGVRYSYMFVRSPFNFSGKQKNIELLFEGKYKINGTYCAKCAMNNCIVPKVNFSCGENEPLRKILIGYNTNIGLLSNYHLNTNTQLTTLNPIDKCKITFANIDITDKLIAGIKPILQKLGKEVDNKLNQIDLKPKFVELWTKLNEVNTVGNFGFMYLQPNSIRLNDLKINNTQVSYTLGISCNPIITTENIKPLSQPLPALLVDGGKQNEGFGVFTPVKISYDKLNEVLNQNLTNKVFEIGHGKIIIPKKIKVFGQSNQQLVIEADFEGTKSGKLYFTGTPVYDSITSTISVPNLQFDVHTKDLLIKVAKWLYSDKITAMLKKYATVQVDSYLVQAQQSLANQLNRKIDESIEMSGKVNKLKLIHIYPSNNEITLQFFTQGHVYVNFK